MKFFEGGCENQPRGRMVLDLNFAAVHLKTILLLLSCFARTNLLKQIVHRMLLRDDLDRLSAQACRSISVCFGKHCWVVGVLPIVQESIRVWTL